MSTVVRSPSKTPLMEQYRLAKQEYPDAFLFFRLGDFYEMFFEDAVECAQLLGLTLTSRNKQDREPIPMCGMPWHQRDAYVARLLKLGRKVAVCEQLEDAAQAKGLVQRGVTEVLTPGSVVGESFLDPVANNFLAALWPAPEGLGLCLADASTGEVRLGELPWSDAAGALASLRVAEWLLPEPTRVPDPLRERFEAALAPFPGTRTHAPPESFLDAGRPAGRWGEDVGRRLAHLPAAQAAASAALAYLDRVQGGPALSAPRISFLADQATLRYDAATARHLELFQPQPGGEPAHTLWHHLNLCVTSLGARRLRAWIERPLAERAPLERRLAATEAWLSAGLERGAFREALQGFPDLERLASRLALERATPRDLGALRDAVARLPGLQAELAALLGPSAALAREALAGFPELEDLLQRALVDEPPPVSKEGGIFREGYDELRDRLHERARSGKRWIAELESEERARTGISSLKVGFNRVFGYYLEVTRPHLDKVPADYERRQTLTTAERFVTPALKQKEGEVLGAEDKLEAREHQLFVELRGGAARFVPGLQQAADALATLDAESALAEAAARFGWVRPVIEESDRLTIEEARHPVVERMLPRGEFVPNHVALDGADRQILLLTGPNMGGKSTYLRQVALAVLLAQSGSYVPAKSAVIGLADRLFTRVGAEHLHGRDAGDRGHSRERHVAIAGPARRDRSRHGHLRRARARLGGDRVPARRGRPQAPHHLRHPLSRADPALRVAPAASQRARRGEGMGGSRGVPAPDRGGPRGPFLRHPRRPTRRTSGHGDRARQGGVGGARERADRRTPRGREGAWTRRVRGGRGTDAAVRDDTPPGGGDPTDHRSRRADAARGPHAARRPQATSRRPLV